MSATPDRERRPHVRCARAFGSGGCGEDLLPFALGEASPDPVRLVYLQRVPAAFQQSRTPRADRLRLRLAPRARRAAFAFRVEEIGTGHATACGVKLPVPHIRVGPRKAPGVCHHVPLCDLGRPDPHATDEGGGRNDRGIAPRPGPSLLPPDPRRCRGCSFLDHRSPSDHDQDLPWDATGAARPVTGPMAQRADRLRTTGDALAPFRVR